MGESMRSQEAYVRNTEPVTVSISYSPERRELTIRPTEIVLSKGSRQEVRWQSENSRVEIIFDRPAPFYYYHYRCPVKGSCLSGVLNDKVRAGAYSYAVRVVPDEADQNNPAEVRASVIVKQQAAESVGKQTADDADAADQG